MANIRKVPNRLDFKLYFSELKPHQGFINYRAHQVISVELYAAALELVDAEEIIEAGVVTGFWFLQASVDLRSVKPVRKFNTEQKRFGRKRDIALVFGF